jgi:DoxX-like family
MFIVLSLLLAATCLLPGSAKLLAHPKMRKAATHLGFPWRGYQLIGLAEMAAAAGVLIGLWWHPLGVVVAAGMALLLAGALLAHRQAGDAAKEIVPALLGLAITIAYLAVAITG